MCTGGFAGTRPQGLAGLVDHSTVPTACPLRWRRRSRQPSSTCDDSTRAGARAPPATAYCFAATSYRVGRAHRGRQVQLAMVGDVVEISFPTARYCKRIPCATTARASTVPSPTPAAAPIASTRREPRAGCNTGTGANSEHGYRDLTSGNGGGRGGRGHPTSQTVALVCGVRPRRFMSRATATSHRPVDAACSC